jgi:hypothetical protein
MILGVKSNITPSLIVALEMGARYTLTDNLDGSNEERKFEIITIWKYK